MPTTLTVYQYKELPQDVQEAILSSRVINALEHEIEYLILDYFVIEKVVVSDRSGITIVTVEYLSDLGWEKSAFVGVSVARAEHWVTSSDFSTEKTAQIEQVLRQIDEEHILSREQANVQEGLYLENGTYVTIDRGAMIY